MPNRSFIAAAALLALGACATTPGGDSVARRDPLERINRPVYTFNRTLDLYAFRPAAQAYIYAVPQSGRRGVSNVYSNTTEPLTIVNGILQAKPKAALRAFARFVINTVLGVGGLADHATGMGLPQQREDFGQTFAVWGISSGPYLMLPLLGPSTLRDAVGTGVEFAGGNPMQHVINQADGSFLFGLGVQAGRVLDVRSRAVEAGADAFLDTSADEYAALRSAFLQSRRADIFDGDPPDVADEFGDSAPEPAIEPAAKPAVPGAPAVAPSEPKLPPTAATPPAQPAPGGADTSAGPPPVEPAVQPAAEVPAEPQA